MVGVYVQVRLCMYTYQRWTVELSRIALGHLPLQTCCCCCDAVPEATASATCDVIPLCFCVTLMLCHSDVRWMHWSFTQKHCRRRPRSSGSCSSKQDSSCHGLQHSSLSGTSLLAVRTTLGSPLSLSVVSFDVSGMTHVTRPCPGGWSLWC